MSTLTVPVQEIEAKWLEDASRQVEHLERQLGALRAEYLTAELRWMTQLKSAYEEHDRLLASMARRYVVGQEGQWAYDPTKQAFVQPLSGDAALIPSTTSTSTTEPSS